MRKSDLEHIIKREAALEAHKIAALEMIRNGREDGIDDQKTRSRILRLGLTEDIINELFAQVDAEESQLLITK